MLKVWDCKTLGALLGISPSKVSQSTGPALRKIALMMLVNPLATMLLITDAMKRLPNCDLIEARKRLTAYADERIETEIKRGRLRADLPPRRTPPGAVPAARVEDEDANDVQTLRVPASRTHRVDN